MEYIKEYIEMWNKEDHKPQNDGKFIAHFTEFAEGADLDHWDFDGENGYCGYTAALWEHPRTIPVNGLTFEFAYGRDVAYGRGFVKVFTGAHNGFWTPEYINLEGVVAKELLTIIERKLHGWAGFGE